MSSPMMRFWFASHTHNGMNNRGQHYWREMWALIKCWANRAGSRWQSEAVEAVIAAMVLCNSDNSLISCVNSSFYRTDERKKCFGERMCPLMASALHSVQSTQLTFVITWFTALTTRSLSGRWRVKNVFTASVAPNFALLLFRVY